jgi:hypothetical protein
MIQPQIRGDHRRQRDLDRLQPAVHLPGHVGPLVVRGELDLRGKGRLRPAEHRRENLPHLVVVVVHRLLPHQDEVGLLALDHPREHLRHRQRVQIRPRFHEHSPVGAHRQRRADLLLALLRADGHDDHLPGLFLPDPQRLLDGDLAERVYDHLDVVQHDAAPVPLDLHLLVRVWDRLDGDQDLHAAPPGGVNALKRYNLSKTWLNCKNEWRFNL